MQQLLIEGQPPVAMAFENDCEWHGQWLRNVYDWPGRLRYDILIKDGFHFAATAIYSTRLTQTSDSGLQVKGVNLSARFNGPLFNRMFQVMNKTYGRTWLESNARNGSMSAMQLSQAELLYNPEYARQCDAFGDKVENEWRKK